MKKLMMTTFIMALMVPFISFGADSTESTATPPGADFCNGERTDGDIFVEDGKKYKMVNGEKVIQEG
jgi:hypothetical protein